MTHTFWVWDQEGDRTYSVLFYFGDDGKVDNVKAISLVSPPTIINEFIIIADFQCTCTLSFASFSLFKKCEAPTNWISTLVILATSHMSQMID